MTEQSMNIFLLEDRKADVELVKRAVLKFIPSAIFTHARNQEEFLDKINWFQYDLVLADYYLPDYTGLDALIFIKEKYPELPFIFVTGTLDNEVTVAQTILRGANGYVLKGNLSDLSVQVPAALAAAAEKTKAKQEVANQQSSARLKLQEVYEILANTEDFKDKKHVLGLLRSALDSYHPNVLNG